MGCMAEWGRPERRLTSANGWEKRQFIAVGQNRLRRRRVKIDGKRDAMHLAGQRGKLASQRGGGVGYARPVGQGKLQTSDPGTIG